MLIDKKSFQSLWQATWYHTPPHSLMVILNNNVVVLEERKLNEGMYPDPRLQMSMVQLNETMLFEVSDEFSFNSVLVFINEMY